MCDSDGEGGCRKHHRVLLMWWRGINETVLSDRNQWARLFGGLSESIILLSCCLLVLRLEGGATQKCQSSAAGDRGLTGAG